MELEVVAEVGNVIVIGKTGKRDQMKQIVEQTAEAMTALEHVLMAMKIDRVMDVGMVVPKV